MRNWKYIFIALVSIFFAQSVQAEEAAAKKLTYEERMKIIEDKFSAAAQEGKTVKSVAVREILFLTVLPHHKKIMNSPIRKKSCGLPNSARSGIARFLFSPKTGPCITRPRGKVKAYLRA